MQSSAVIALRTMTMIVCLVAVPLAAVLGTSWPKVVKSAFGHGETRQTEPEPATEHVAAAHPEEGDLPAAQPPPHEMAPLVAADGASPDSLDQAALPRVRITGVRPVDEVASETLQNAAAPPLETAPLWNPSPRTANTSRGGATTTRFVPADPPQDIDRPQPKPAEPLPSFGVRQRPNRRNDSLRKTVYSLPDEEDLPLDDANQSDAPSDEERLAPVERVSNDGVLAAGEQRLRAMGVKYYRLEPWGGDGAMFRCSCNVPFSPSGRATRHFDAMESSPSRALEAVIQQVEAWRAGRARVGRATAPRQ